VTLTMTEQEIEAGGPQGDGAPDASAGWTPPFEAHDPRAPERPASDTTTMTGAGYGAGGGASAAGSLGPVSGPDAQSDRLGGAGRGGTSDLAPPPKDQE